MNRIRTITAKVIFVWRYLDIMLWKSTKILLLTLLLIAIYLLVWPQIAGRHQLNKEAYERTIKTQK